jgi:ubiquinone/menaquinone biosynthesis C-methylase UbiE
MPLVIPSALELKTLRQLASFSGQRVLEIGVGDGRLAWPFAPEAAQWIGLDPDTDDLGAAHAEREQAKSQEKEKVRLMVGDGRALSFPDGYFDLAFFSWSLC